MNLRLAVSPRYPNTFKTTRHAGGEYAMVWLTRTHRNMEGMQWDH
jgi:hypothetical protein